jgi:light-regulated signal transduction histidine kinase (bacteriophytochrome)/CheY-like chemotaxis protein
VISSVNLKDCDQEPIHIPGSIQAHGALLALDPDSLIIRMLSENVAEHLHVAADDLLEEELGSALDPSSVDCVRAALGASTLNEINPLRLFARHGSQQFDGVLHPSGGLLLLELEPSAGGGEIEYGRCYQRARSAVSRLRDAQRVVDLAARAAREVRELIGFDRVMIYRFAADASGEVLAEARRDDLESFLGLHYPAADVPAQARRLYTTNWLRLIPDVAYAPSPLRPANNPLDGQPLDLSQAVLRSVSPVHVEYLTNMGVRASLSISLIIDGVLWGLVACHHYSPRHVPYELRIAAEFVGEALSWQIAARDRADRFEHRAASQRVLAKLVERMALSPQPALDLAGSDSPLALLVDASGAAVYSAGRIATTGNTPPLRQIKALGEWLMSCSGDGPVVTEALELDFPGAPRLQDMAGLLALPVSKAEQQFLLWFREETVRTVNWGGNPEKVLTWSDGVPRLSPRGSFALWQETVRGRALPWQPFELEVAEELRRALLGGIDRRASELTRLNEELRASNLAKDEFLATVSHELRTPLNAMLGWLALLESGQLPAEKRAQAMETVVRNARMQARLVEDLLDVSRIISGKMRLEIQVTDPAQVVEAAITTVMPAANAKAIRLKAVLDPDAGPVMGDPARLQQVVWNLLTNAVKFTPRGGAIKVSLRKVDSSIEILVADSGAGIKAEFLPFVFDRFRQANAAITRTHQGLGLGLSIVRHLVELHGGHVTVTSEGEGKGATFCVRLPLAPIRSDTAVSSAPPTSLAPSAPLEQTTELKGLRILVVDDEPDAREMIATLLESRGVEVTTAASAVRALEIVPRLRPDILISDIGMPEHDGYELLQRVRALPPERGGRTAAVALTAFARTQDRSRAFLAGFDMYLPKPVDTAELLALLVSLAHRLSASEGEAERSGAQRAVRASVPPVPSLLSGMKVLLVQNASPERERFMRALAAAGATVDVTDTAERAVEAYRAGAPDVFVCDLTTPERDGFALLRELRFAGASSSSLATIALTSQGSSDDARRAILAGYQLHLPVSTQPELLIAKINRLVAWSHRHEL